MTRPKYEIALEYLSKGYDLKLGLYKVRLVECDDDSLELAIVARKTQSINGEEVDKGEYLIGYKLPVGAFLDQCREIPDDRISIMCANMALQSFNGRR